MSNFEMTKEDICKINYNVPYLRYINQPHKERMTRVVWVKIFVKYYN